MFEGIHRGSMSAEKKFWVVELNGITPTLNSWQAMCHQERHALSQKWEGRMVLESLINKIDIPDATVETYRRITIERYSHGVPDRHNTIGPAAKCLVDPMRRQMQRKIGRQTIWVDGKLRWIWDDDPAHCIVECNNIKIPRDFEPHMKIIISDEERSGT